MGKDHVNFSKINKGHRYEAEQTIKMTNAKIKFNYADTNNENRDRKNPPRKLAMNSSYSNNKGSRQLSELKRNEKFLSNQNLKEKKLDNPDKINETEELKCNAGDLSSCKEDSFSLSMELHDLSMEISNLNFHPGVYSMIDKKKKKPDRETRSKILTKKFLSPVMEKQEDEKQNRVNEEVLRKMNFEKKVEAKKEDKKEEKIKIEKKDEMIKEDDKRKEKQDDEIPSESVMELKNTFCVTINEEDGNTDYNDLKNLTFCKKDKTSSVSSYTPTSTDEESNDIKLEKTEQKKVNIDVHPMIDNKKINQMTPSGLRRKNSWISKLRSKKQVYPDLQSQTLDEIGELNLSKDLSYTPQRRSFRQKVRRLFYYSPDKEPTPLNINVTRKPSFDNKLKNFTDKVKDKFSSHQKPPIYIPDLHFPITKELTQNCDQNDQRIQELMQELQIQQAMIHQANKALTLCHNRKEFNASEEQVESQRSLLLGTIKTKATLEEINRLVLQDEQEFKPDMVPEAQAEIRINCIELLLRRDVIDELTRKNQGEFFVVAVVHRQFVWISKVLYNPFGNLNIVVSDKIVIPEVEHDFTLRIQIYSIKMNMLEIMNRKNKNGGKKSGFRKWFSSKHEMKNPNVISQDSNFELVGELELGVEDLHLKSPWPLNKVPRFTSLNNLINLDMSCRINQTAHHSGFVNYGYIPDGYAAWNRRWCVLDDHVLKFWNYPQQESEPPLMVIDLINCVMPEIKVADRVVCAKPKTLIIETVSKSNSLETRKSKNRRKIQRHMFSFDTNEEMYEWLGIINRMLSSLQKWNRILYEEPEKSTENVREHNTDEDEVSTL